MNAAIKVVALTPCLANYGDDENVLPWRKP